MTVCFIWLDMTTPPWYREKVMVYCYCMSAVKNCYIESYSRLVADLLGFIFLSERCSDHPRGWDSLLTSFICFFILFHSCCSHARVLGKHSCMSSTFPIAILNGTFFFFALWRQWIIENGALLNKSYYHYFIFVIPYLRLDFTLLSRHVLPNSIIYWYDCLSPKYYCQFYCLYSWIR